MSGVTEISLYTVDGLRVSRRTVSQDSSSSSSSSTNNNCNTDNNSLANGAIDTTHVDKGQQLILLYRLFLRLHHAGGDALCMRNLLRQEQNDLHDSETASRGAHRQANAMPPNTSSSSSSDHINSINSIVVDSHSSDSTRALRPSHLLASTTHCGTTVSNLFAASLSTSVEPECDRETGGAAGVSRGRDGIRGSNAATYREAAPHEWNNYSLPHTSRAMYSYFNFAEQDTIDLHLLRGFRPRAQSVAPLTVAATSHCISASGLSPRQHSNTSKTAQLCSLKTRFQEQQQHYHQPQYSVNLLSSAAVMGHVTGSPVAQALCRYRNVNRSANGADELPVRCSLLPTLPRPFPLSLQQNKPVEAMEMSGCNSATASMATSNSGSTVGSGNMEYGKSSHRCISPSNTTASGACPTGHVDECNADQMRQPEPGSPLQQVNLQASQPWASATLCVRTSRFTHTCTVFDLANVRQCEASDSMGGTVCKQYSDAICETILFACASQPTQE